MKNHLNFCNIFMLVYFILICIGVFSLSEYSSQHFTDVVETVCGYMLLSVFMIGLGLIVMESKDNTVKESRCKYCKCHCCCENKCCKGEN